MNQTVLPQPDERTSADVRREQTRVRVRRHRAKLRAAQALTATKDGERVVTVTQDPVLLADSVSTDSVTAKSVTTKSVTADLVTVASRGEAGPGCNAVAGARKADGAGAAEPPPVSPFVPRDPYRALPAGAIPVDYCEPLYVQSAGPFEPADVAPIDETEARRRAVASNRCCGADGVELRCQLCPWLVAYPPALREDCEARLRGHAPRGDERPVEELTRLAAAIRLPGEPREGVQLDSQRSRTHHGDAE